MGPAEAPVAEVAEFLNGLRTMEHKGKPLAPSTITGYKSAFAAIHKGFPDGSTVSSNTDLSTPIKGLFVVSARPRTLNETWDLPTVLKYLAGPPFEPIHAAPLWSVAVKTAFLVQLARRGSWVHSCRIDACHLRWVNGGVRLLPSLLLDKNQSYFTPSEVFLLSLKEFSPDDKVHCPVRAHKWYLELTKPLRGAEKPSSFGQGSLILRLPKAQSLVGSKRPSRGRSRTFLRSGGNVWASEPKTPEGSLLIGLQWPKCHLKQLWMLQP